MEFRFETSYDQKAMKAMARVLRKTVRAKRTKRSAIYAILVAILGILLILSSDAFGFRQVVTAAVIVVMILAFVFQDSLNGYIAAKRALPGLDKSIVTFHKDGYRSVTPVGESLFPYENIRMIAEDEHYLVFIFSASHAQIYDKHSISGGSIDEFKQHIKACTQLDWISIE